MLLPLALAAAVVAGPSLDITVHAADLDGGQITCAMLQEQYGPDASCTVVLIDPPASSASNAGTTTQPYDGPTEEALFGADE